MLTMTNFQDLLDVQLGKVYVNDQRYLLVNAAALGTLRHDLVSTLGIERAKWFLHRYGWSCGYQDALSMNKQFRDETDEDLLMLGPKMHQPEGVCEVIIEKVHVDSHEKRFYMEGVWRSSYKSEQHINHFSLSKKMTCWDMVGYFGGFSTGVFGKRIIFKEIKCVNRGDDECRFVGKTLDEWGEDIGKELQYYADNKIAGKLEDARRYIQNQYLLFKRTIHIHERLNRMVLAGDNRYMIIESLGEMINSPVIVEDCNFEPLVWWAPDKVDVSKYFLKNVWEESSELRNLLRRIEKENKTMHLDLKDYPSFFERTTGPIMLGEELIGYLSIIHVAGVEKELRQMIAERAVSVMALDFLKERTALETEYRLRGEFLEELLTETTNIETLKKRAEYMGLNFEHPHRFIIMNINYSNHSVQPNKSRDMFKTIRKEFYGIAQMIANSKKDLLIGDKKENIVVLANTRNDRLNPVELINILQRRLGKLFETSSINICVSREAKSIEQLHSIYIECSDTIKVLSRLGKAGGVFFVDNMNLFDLLYASPAQNRLLQYAEISLEKLINYEKSTGTMDLLKTLYIFLANECNLQQTCRELNISISGLKYRLQRLKEIGELNLDDSNERFNIQLALRVLHVNGIISL